jgi:hypothetical protein
MPKNAAKLVVWRGFWVKLRAQRRSKIATHELISIALGQRIRNAQAIAAESPQAARSAAEDLERKARFFRRSRRKNAPEF